MMNRCIRCEGTEVVVRVGSDELVCLLRRLRKRVRVYQDGESADKLPVYLWKATSLALALHCMEGHGVGPCDPAIANHLIHLRLKRLPKKETGGIR